MDEKTVSKETLLSGVRYAISHVNRNLYEWTTDSKKGKIQYTISFTEVNGLVRSWLVRSFRERLGFSIADRLFRNMYIMVDKDNNIIQSISLSSEGRYYTPYYKDVCEILSSLNYKGLAYNPSDYVMDGMSQRKEGFDPFFYFSLDEIKSIKF